MNYVNVHVDVSRDRSSVINERNIYIYARRAAREQQTNFLYSKTLARYKIKRFKV